MNSYLVQHFLENSAGRLPDKVALICGDARLTYGEIDERASRVAWFLKERGIQRQDRVAILLDNSVESVVSLFGILKADAIFIMLSPTMKATKLSYILNDCQVKALITHRNKLDVVSTASASVPSLNLVVFAGDKSKMANVTCPNPVFWDEVESLSSPHASRLAPYSSESRESQVASREGVGLANSSNASDSMNSEHVTCNSQPATRNPKLVTRNSVSSFNIDLDLATIIYTSGSTGKPKGVMLTHLNMVSAATSIISYLGNREEDVIMNTLPLSFDYGLYQVLMAFKFGGTVVLERSFTYPYQVIQKMIQEKVTGFPGVPTVFALLLGLKDLDRFDVSNLRYITNTAAALPTAHIERLRKVFPHVCIYSMYGLTECKRVSYLPPEEIDRRPASVGRGMPNEEVWIVDEQGNRVGPSIVGELVVRGSNVMRGYWGLPEETDRVLRRGRDSEGVLLYTGDLFRMDEDGYLYFLGRKDDMIKSRGERISPKEIEQCLCGLNGVAEAAVIGVPDEILGQAIKAIISVRDGYSLKEQDILKHCKENLEDFMVPKFVQFAASLPKSGNGKIDKLSLKSL